MKNYTVHIGEWVNARRVALRLEHKQVAAVLGLQQPHHSYTKEDWEVNALFAVLDLFNATLEELVLPGTKAPISKLQNPYTHDSMAEAETPYHTESIEKLKLERDLLRARIEDKDALIQALQAQLAR